MEKAKKILKVSAISLAAVLAFLALAVGTLNILKFAIYSDYYEREEVICRNPGLSDGFVCQGIAVVESAGKYIISGYMQNKSNSRIYVTDKDDNSYYVTLTREGKKYTGHAGGIATGGNTVYIANGSKLYLLSLDSLLSARCGDTLDIGGGVAVNNAASFVFCNEKYIYVGEYNDPIGYAKEHIYDTPEGRHFAIISRYCHDNLESPDKIYSVRDYVQGVCVSEQGKIILSTSHGLASTIYYVYDEAGAVKSEHMLDGVPVYYLNFAEKTLKAPAMGEDLDFSEGKVISLTESASNKYIYGKFFFANDIFALDFGY